MDGSYLWHFSYFVLWCAWHETAQFFRSDELSVMSLCPNLSKKGERLYEFSLPIKKSHPESKEQLPFTI